MAKSRIRKNKLAKLKLVTDSNFEELLLETNMFSEHEFNVQVENVRKNFEKALQKIGSEHMGSASSGRKPLYLVKS